MLKANGRRARGRFLSTVVAVGNFSWRWASEEVRNDWRVGGGVVAEGDEIETPLGVAGIVGDVASVETPACLNSITSSSFRLFFRHQICLSAQISLASIKSAPGTVILQTGIVGFKGLVPTSTAKVVPIKTLPIIAPDLRQASSRVIKCDRRDKT